MHLFAKASAFLPQNPQIWRKISMSSHRWRRGKNTSSMLGNPPAFLSAGAMNATISAIITHPFGAMEPC